MDSNRGPKNARPRNGREYVWPPRPPYELVVPSSTSILREGLPKTALQFWAARTVAEYAYDHVESWRTLPRGDAVDLLKRAPYRRTNAKATLGSAVHAAVDAYVRGATISVPDEARGYYEGACRFLSDHRPTVLRAEATVYSREYGYAGTSDLLAVVAGHPTVIDYKTGKAVYPEHGLQLASYAFGDFIGEPDETETPLASWGEFRRGFVVRLSSDGAYEVCEFALDRRLFQVFLAAKAIHDYQRDADGFMVASWCKP